MCIRGSACASFFSFLLLLLPCSNFFSFFPSSFLFFLFFFVYLPGPLPSPIHHRVVIPCVPSPLSPLSMPPLPSSFFPFIFLSASLSLSLSASRSPVALFSSLFLQLLSSCLPRRISRTSMRVFRSEGCVLRVLLSFGRSARPFLSSEYSPPVYKSRGKRPGYRYRGA